MRYQALWVIGLLCVGCSFNRLASTQDSSIAAPPSSPPALAQPAPSSVDSPASPLPSGLSAPSSNQPGNEDLPEAEATPEPAPETSLTNTAEPQQDYDSNSPIPATGKVTIRNDIRSLDVSQLIADCPADSAPYAFAESTNYRVQICSQEYDPWQPKYYIGQAKDGSGELRITSDRPEEARQLIFKSQGYTYILYRDGRRPELINAYLEVYTPNGKNYAEALWYLYEATRP